MKNLVKKLNLFRENLQEPYPENLDPQYQHYEFVDCYINWNNEIRYGKFRGLSKQKEVNTFYMYDSFPYENKMITKNRRDMYLQHVYGFDKETKVEIFVNYYPIYCNELLLLYSRLWRKKDVFPDIIYNISTFLKGSGNHGYELIWKNY